MPSYYTVKWIKNSVSLLDQRFLPSREIYRNYTNYRDVVNAIKKMEIRGAPAIGVACAFGIALGLLNLGSHKADLKERFYKIVNDFRDSRPTAVNLFWAAHRMKRAFDSNYHKGYDFLVRHLISESKIIYNEDIRANMRLSNIGQKLIKNGCSILTHCNAGPLATAGYGTALGVIIEAKKKGKKIRVFADETRPRLQGARLTAWELLKNKIDVTLISDNMAGFLMSKGKIDIVITGADRIAANGDSANKIGTYSVAVLANHHRIPFYIAAPVSTIDTKCENGSKMPIEERPGDEITRINNLSIAPAGIKTFNPAFDVTPSKYIKGIITEKGILKPPYKKSIKKLFK